MYLYGFLTQYLNISVRLCKKAKKKKKNQMYGK